MTNFKEIADTFHGKGGGPESESHLNDSVADRREGFVSVWSDKNDVAKIINRCGDKILSATPMGGGVQIKICTSAFRGIEYAFKKIGANDETLSREANEMINVATKPVEKSDRKKYARVKGQSVDFGDDGNLIEIVNSSNNLKEVLKKLDIEVNQNSKLKLSAQLSKLRREGKEVKKFPRGRPRK